MTPLSGSQSSVALWAPCGVRLFDTQLMYIYSNIPNFQNLFQQPTTPRCATRVI